MTGLMILLSLGSLSPLSAVEEDRFSNIKFKTYTVDQGLQTNSVSTIFQDKRGLLWLGTQDWCQPVQRD